MIEQAYRRHLTSSNDLITTYEAIRAGFVSLALEKNRRATSHVADARALQEAASQAKKPTDLLSIPGIERGLLTASGLSDKAVAHLTKEDKIVAVKGLIDKFLEPAGKKFIEELVFRFLLIRGDTLGGSMRNIGGSLAQRKLTRAILSTLKIAGISFCWQDNKTKKWLKNGDSFEIEERLRGLCWGSKKRTLIYNLKVSIVNNNVDLCLFNSSPEVISKADPKSYIALGELKGGIDPAGADEHWKTAQTALKRISSSFNQLGYKPKTFFIGAAVEKKMAVELWNDLENGILSNAANLNEEKQIASISHWLCNL